MRRILTWLVPLLLVGIAGLWPIPATGLPVYNVVDFGAFGNGDPASAAVNTTAFQNAINAASATPGVLYIPPSNGFVVNNGQLKITASNVSMRGDSTMGSASAFGQTSTIIGKGPGHTLVVNGHGSSVKGLSFKPAASGEQNGSDAFILVQNASQVTVSDVCIYSPNIGISFQLPLNLDGEFWIRDVLVQGKVGVAGIVSNGGNATTQISHVIMYADNPQPPYGIVVTSCGELIINDGTDIINCGTCLGIVPGLGGVSGQHCVQACISDSLFDGGNGPGCVFICPQKDAYVLRVAFSNVWTSTANNNNGQWSTDGFKFDGTQSRPLSNLLKPIQDVSLVNCTGKAFVNHCGVYARGVNALTISNSTFGGCFNGIQIAPGCVDYVLTGNRCGDYVPPPVGTPSTGNGGNAAYGILIEPNDYGICTGNMLRGNRLGGILNQFPNPHQVIGLNVQ